MRLADILGHEEKFWLTHFPRYIPMTAAFAQMDGV
jgi:hypothetical protein